MENDTQSSSNTWLWVLSGFAFFIALIGLILAIIAMTNSSYGYIPVSVSDPGQITASNGVVAFTASNYYSALNYVRVSGAGNATIDVSSWKTGGYKTLRVINQALSGTLTVVGFTNIPSGYASVTLNVGEYIDFRPGGTGKSPIFIGVATNGNLMGS